MTTTRVDRAALVRRAIVELVAEYGFAGTSMAAVAERAGVATGTAYVHYESKDALVVAAYKELKHDMAGAGASVVSDGSPADRFKQLWIAFYRHLESDPVRARFLAQVAASPLAGAAHEGADASEDGQLSETAGEDMLALFIDLPMAVIYQLAIGPIVQLVAAGIASRPEDLNLLASACWRAVTKPD